MQLTTLRAMVTGAAGGLGRHFVGELLRAGASVTAGDSNAAGLRKLRSETEVLPGRLMVAKLDVTDEDSVSQFVARATDAFGPVNALINSAGILRDGLLVQKQGGDLQKMTLAQWRKVLEVNLTGPFLMTREVAAAMVAAGTRPGVVINLSSLSRAGNPGQANYAASKAGLDAATRSWALELAPFGIRAASVAPGVTETGFLKGIADEAMDALVAAIPVGRVGRPGEIWEAVKFIIECDFFNGRVIEVDGGARMC